MKTIQIPEAIARELALMAEAHGTTMETLIRKELEEKATYWAYVRTWPLRDITEARPWEMGRTLYTLSCNHQTLDQPGMIVDGQMRCRDCSPKGKRFERKADRMATGMMAGLSRAMSRKSPTHTS